MSDSARARRDPVGEFLASFSELLRLPIGFWIVIFAFVIESMAYFGALTLMTEYFSADLGWPDPWTAPVVSVFTMLVTLFMLGAGSYAESFGLRRAILGGLLLCVGGRALYALAIGQGLSLGITIVLTALVIIALGEAILQPVCYSGVKQYTNERTSSMGYGLIYALMNGGIVVMGAISQYVRVGVQSRIDGGQAAASEVFDAAAPAQSSAGILDWLAGWTGSGVSAVNWTCWAISGLTFFFVLVCFTRRIEANKLRPDRAEAMRKGDTRPILERVGSYFAEGPFSNARFIFFIFMLLPVRTLFAHQWLTMPQYVLRAYPGEVANHMEWLVNWINPAIIFFGVPIATALTRKVNVYTMMIIGSLVSAAPTFLLCGGPNLGMLLAYFFLFSIGEALWSARFLEYASELAPEGRIAQYMGLANVPWLLAKGTTGFYSGAILATYCPADTPVDQLQTGTMWFIYGCIAMLSPIGLWLARGWVRAGLEHKPAPVQG